MNDEEGTLIDREGELDWPGVEMDPVQAGDGDRVRDVWLLRRRPLEARDEDAEEELGLALRKVPPDAGPWPWRKGDEGLCICGGVPPSFRPPLGKPAVWFWKEVRPPV